MTRDKMTVTAIQARKAGPKLTMVTAYDTPMAAIASEAGADMILVGDSVADNMLGFADTLAATVDIMVHHASAVMRARPRALVIGDMPWLSYHLSTEEAVRNAGRLIREAHVDVVKLEGGRKRLPVVEAILAAEIPVMGHLGLTPQSVRAMGGYRVQGKQANPARELLEDARALAAAGVFALVLEGMPDVLAKAITETVPIPTIGIGAGPHCDGQVLVLHDVLGMHLNRHTAKFVRQYARLADTATSALQSFFSDIQAGNFPTEAESYHMDEETVRAFQTLTNSMEE
ncbi:MAG TPA: 3-methyl-2-oxobutanoate hydroxymethyltransferase [Ktedonobacteraceae bacterium]|nr:3-methyl-2-oxobutanoate hydroxymethyltransferase [Ktedonobacteraceae bacterium]